LAVSVTSPGSYDGVNKGPSPSSVAKVPLIDGLAVQDAERGPGGRLVAVDERNRERAVEVGISVDGEPAERAAAADLHGQVAVRRLREVAAQGEDRAGGEENRAVVDQVGGEGAAAAGAEQDAGMKKVPGVVNFPPR
jgi:hypothetical protein